MKGVEGPLIGYLCLQLVMRLKGKSNGQLGGIAPILIHLNTGLQSCPLCLQSYHNLRERVENSHKLIQDQLQKRVNQRSCLN